MREGDHCEKAHRRAFGAREPESEDYVLFRTLSHQREQARLEQDAALLQVQIRMVEDQERQMEQRIRAEAISRHD